MPASLDAVLGRLRADGYFLGPEGAEGVTGEAIVAALAELSQVYLLTYLLTY